MFIKKIILFLIKFYQSLPLASRSSCRFVPTCSQYTYESIEKHGVYRGICMGLRRVLSCHPFNSKCKMQS